MRMMAAGRRHPRSQSNLCLPYPLPLSRAPQRQPACRADQTSIWATFLCVHIRTRRHPSCSQISVPAPRASICHPCPRRTACLLPTPTRIHRLPIDAHHCTPRRLTMVARPVLDCTRPGRRIIRLRRPRRTRSSSSPSKRTQLRSTSISNRFPCNRHRSIWRRPRRLIRCIVDPLVSIASQTCHIAPSTRIRPTAFRT